MSPGDRATGLRERKKRQTRETILAVANEMFEARGYEHVTVAEIADAANISVKTLFTYFRSKEDLAFADEYRFRDRIVEAVRSRAPGVTPVGAVAALLHEVIVEDGGDAEGLAGFQRRMSDSDALRSRLRRMWENYEDALTALLTEQLDGAAVAPRARLMATLLVAMVRSLTSAELLAEVGRRGPQGAQSEALHAWVGTAESMVSCLSRDVPASG
jgi:AcrR family transcriptional regulator